MNNLLPRERGILREKPHFSGLDIPYRSVAQTSCSNEIYIFMHKTSHPFQTPEVPVKFGVIMNNLFHYSLYRPRLECFSYAPNKLIR
jgi:hypothetical protein